ncbi:MAG: RNA 2',3'-cyclic phosphodiesterase [Desulfosarcinaceae bacterium]|nr:RNA 2',3'-cyclic phosphodiesterase [Desulfosarcinaceae bacterium]
MSTAGQIRAFIALELPASTRSALADLQATLKPEFTAVRWVRPAGIHLTLKFLGDIPEHQVNAIGKTLRAAADERHALATVIKGLGVFPGVRKARVIWAGLAGDTAAILAIQQDVDAALATLGFPRDRRRFKAHLTLGRFKKAPPAPELVRILETCSDYAPVALPLTRLVLYRSELRPQGARYTSLFQAPLASAG